MHTLVRKELAIQCKVGSATYLVDAGSPILGIPRKVGKFILCTRSQDYRSPSILFAFFINSREELFFSHSSTVSFFSSSSGLSDMFNTVTHEPSVAIPCKILSPQSTDFRGSNVVSSEDSMRSMSSFVPVDRVVKDDTGAMETTESECRTQPCGATSYYEAVYESRRGGRGHDKSV